MIDLRYSLIIEATEEPDFSDFTRLTSTALAALAIQLKIASIKPAGP